MKNVGNMKREKSVMRLNPNYHSLPVKTKASYTCHLSESNLNSYIKGDAHTRDGNPEATGQLTSNWWYQDLNPHHFSDVTFYCFGQLLSTELKQPADQRHLLPPKANCHQCAPGQQA